MNLVRSKTPKMTLYTRTAKCMLMENGPNPDFEVIFYDGAKFSQSADGTRIIEQDGTSLMLDAAGSMQRLAPETRQLWQYVHQVTPRNLLLSIYVRVATHLENKEKSAKIFLMEKSEKFMKICQSQGKIKMF